MIPHRIQLRRAWDDEDSAGLNRLDLPICWGGGPIPSRIARNFNRPRIDASHERLSLEFGSVPGLLAAYLNARDLGLPRDGEDPWVVGLTDLKPTGNRLVLTLDAEAARRSDVWGHIAILIDGGRIAKSGSGIRDQTSEIGNNLGQWSGNPADL